MASRRSHAPTNASWLSMSCGFLIVTCSIGTRHNRCSAMGGCVAKEGRRSHAPTNDQQIEFELRVPRSGTYIMKPTASCEAAQLWVNMPLPKWVPRRGTYTSCLILRMIVGPALRNQERERWCLSHSCAPSELAVGFWWIRVPSGHGADWCS